MMTIDPALAVRTTTLVVEEPWKTVISHALQAAADALDRLVPPNQKVELPPEWFKYPPF
jgi:hypothetical protein